jgi:hypothetical protein
MPDALGGYCINSAAARTPSAADIAAVCSQSHESESLFCESIAVSVKSCYGCVIRIGVGDRETLGAPADYTGGKCE